MTDTSEFPMHAITQRPMAMYHSWGSQNAWLRQIHGAQLALHQRATARPRRASPTATGCGSTAASASVQAQVKLMEGVNADTVWTWNAIGKRAGAWGLEPDAPEANAASCSIT